MSTITLNPTQHAMLAYAIHHTQGRIDWFPENVKGGARQKVLQGLFNRALITPSGKDWLVAAEGYDVMGCARPSVCLIAPDDHELEAIVAQVEATWSQDTHADQSAPAEQVDARGDDDAMTVETGQPTDPGENATGCDDCVAGTDAPEQQLDATQDQTLPTTAPAEQPGDTAQDGFERAVQCAKEGASIRQEREARIAKVLQRDSKQATIIQMLNHPQGATIAQICEATGWQAHTVRGTFAGAFKKKLGLTITSSKAQGGVRTYHATI